MSWKRPSNGTSCHTQLSDSWRRNRCAFANSDQTRPLVASLATHILAWSSLLGTMGGKAQPQTAPLAVQPLGSGGGDPDRDEGHHRTALNRPCSAPLWFMWSRRPEPGGDAQGLEGNGLLFYWADPIVLWLREPGPKWLTEARIPAQWLEKQAKHVCAHIPDKVEKQRRKCSMYTP